MLSDGSSAGEVPVPARVEGSMSHTLCHIPCPCPAILPCDGENKPGCLRPHHAWDTWVQGTLLRQVPLVPGCHEGYFHDSCKGRQMHRDHLAGSCKTSFFPLPHEASGTRTSVGLCPLPPTPGCQYAQQGSTFLFPREALPTSVPPRASSNTLAWHCPLSAAVDLLFHLSYCFYA